MRCKFFLQGKPVTMLTDKVKLVYIFNEANCGNTFFNPVANATPATSPPPSVTQTTLSSHNCFTARFNT
jgi:hypothetical protein